jgi:serine/threonine-protein kinase
MGRVYEARHLRLKERRFAVKCLHPDLARNSEMAARFLREAESASSIKHANVVDVFDVHHLADGTPYLVGEYLEGEELADYVMKRGPLEPQTAAKIGRQVCSALAAAHARGIIHRDMKPENIFVLASSIAAVDRGESRTLQVKVLDFGISKAGHGDKSNLTRTGMIMGTPSYMSPEQARGRPVDDRADVYSVGACIYFMVTGRRPFDSDDPTSTISMVLTEDPVRPREIDQRIPEMLELVIQRAMAKDANDRYASMAELEKALDHFGGTVAVALPSGDPRGFAALPPPSKPQIRVSGAARAFDVAKAIIGTESLAPPSMQPSSSLARAARPTIVITSVALGGWFVGGTVAALAGLVRVLHDGEVTLTESLLLVAGCLFAAATPVGLYVMHVRRVIWPNSMRALKLATDLKRMTVAAFLTYGAFSIVARIAHTVLWRSSRGLASGVWDIALFVASAAGVLALGGMAPFMRNLKRRSSRT